MKTETVARDDHQTKLIAEVEPEVLEKYKHQAARKISQERKFPGFRPGKAPYDVVRRMVGDEAIQQEAIDLMLNAIYPEALKDAALNPSGPGQLEEIVSLDPPTFAFIVPLQPEVELGDYKSIRKEYAPEPITDEQVEATLHRLQRSYATAEPVEREAQKGDLVSFKLSAVRTNPEEGEKATLLEESPYQMIAGEEDEEDPQPWPYEGFSEELVGLSAGETKTVVHTFSEESPYEDLRGKEAAFTIVVESVKEMHPPELNDDFAQSMGDFENVEALRKAIRTQLEQNASQEYDQGYFDSLVDTLVEQATIKYPPHMLEDEINEFMDNLEKSLERDHLDLDTYLKMRQMDHQTFIEKEVKPASETRLKRELVLDEFARREGVQLKNEEIQYIYNSAAQQVQLPNAGKGRTRINQSDQERINTLAMNTANSIFNQRLTSRLKAIAMGKGDEPVAQPEAEGQPEAEAQLEEKVASEELTGAENNLGEAQVSSINQQTEMEQEQAATGEDLLTEQSPQSDERTSQSDTEPQG